MSLMELALLFTCAECGNTRRFKPSKAIPCPGCSGERWILGQDSKIFDWKLSLSNQHRRDHAAHAVRAFLPQWAGGEGRIAEPNDPLFDACAEIFSAGWAEAADLAECGHPKGSVRDGACVACVTEGELRLELSERREVAEGFSKEIGNWIKKFEDAERDKVKLGEDITQAIFSLGAARDTIRALEHFGDDCVRLTGELSEARRELELLKHDYMQVQKSVEDLDRMTKRNDNLKAGVVALTEDLKRARDHQAETEVVVANLMRESSRMTEVNAQMADLQHRFDLVSENCISLKTERDTRCWMHADRIEELQAAGAMQVGTIARLQLEAEKASADNAAARFALESKIGELSALIAERDTTIRNLDIDRGTVLKQRDDEAWMHAACLTIAEGHSEWEKPAFMDSPAMKQVRDLRRKYEDVSARLRLIHSRLGDALDVVQN